MPFYDFGEPIEDDAPFNFEDSYSDLDDIHNDKADDSFFEEKQEPDFDKIHPQELAHKAGDIIHKPFTPVVGPETDPEILALAHYTEKHSHELKKEYPDSEYSLDKHLDDEGFDSELQSAEEVYDSLDED